VSWSLSSLEFVFRAADPDAFRAQGFDAAPRLKLAQKSMTLARRHI
jgi:hypothetical protein